MRQNADFDFWNSMNAIELGPENNQKWDLVTQMSQIVTNWGWSQVTVNSDIFSGFKWRGKWSK